MGRKQPSSLVDLKNRLKYHLVLSAAHKSALGLRETEDKISQKEVARNEKCGMNCTRTAYFFLHNGRPSSKS